MQLVINSKFRPFTYDELIKPMLQYKEAYDKAEADYSTLASQMEQWKDVANQTQNPEAFKRFDNYAKDFNKAYDDLQENGLLLGSRKKFLDLNKRYASEILPIAKAKATIDEANALRVKAGPDAIFEVSRYDSIDSALGGKSINNTYTSKSAIAKNTATMTEAAMASAMQDPEFKKIMENQYWMITQHNGGSYEDLKEAIANSYQAQNKFAEIKNQIMKNVGYYKYDATGRQAIEDAINTGLYAGLDKPTMQLQTNKNFMTSSERETHEMNKQLLEVKVNNAEKGVKNSNSNSSSSSSSSGSSKGWQFFEPVVINYNLSDDDSDLEVIDHGKDIDYSGSTWISFYNLPDKLRGKLLDKLGNTGIESYSFFVKDPWNGPKRVLIVPNNDISGGKSIEDSSKDNDHTNTGG